MSDDNRFGELRSLLQRPPSAAAWDHLCLALETWPADELRDQALPYVRSIIERWPDALRAAPPRWVQALAQSREIPWLSLVRSVNFQGRLLPTETITKALDALVDTRVSQLNISRALDYQKGGTVALFEHPALEHVRSIEMTGIWRSGADMASVLTSARLGRLESLSIESPHISSMTLFEEAARSIEANASRRWLPALRELALIWMHTAPAELKHLRRIFPLAQLHTLELRGSLINSDCLRAMLEDQELPALRHLKTPGSMMRAAEAREMAAHIKLECIETLTPSFIYNDTDLEISAALKTLLAQADALRTLEISGPALQDLSGRALIDATLPSLESLHITHNRLSDQTLEALLTSPMAAQLTQLTLTHTGHAADLARAIATAGPLPALRELDLSSSTLGQRGAALLSRATLPGLRSLKLNHCDLDAHSVEIIMTAPWMSQLESLELGNAKLDAGSLRALMAQAAQWRNLKHLNLSGSNIGPGGALALAHKSEFTQLESLNIAGNMFGATALAALLRTPWLAGLKALDIRNNNLDDEAAAQLADCAALWGLEQLLIGDHNLLSKKGEQALDASPHLNTLAWPRKHTSAPLRTPHAARARQRAELELGPPAVRKRTK